MTLAPRRATLRGLLLLTAMVALLAPVLGGARPAAAHAVLVRSNPAAEARIAQPPSTIDLWLSEPLEPGFSSFELFASDGTPLPVDGVQVDPNDALHLSGLPRTLGPGLYTVVYQSLSKDDGHEWTGSFAFTVLNPDGSTPAGTAFAPDLGGNTDARNIAGRWLTFSGLAMLLGVAVVLLLASIRSPGGPPNVEAIARGSARRLAPAAILLAMAGGALQLQNQHAELGGSLTDVLADTRFGTYWLARHLALLAATVLLGLAWIAASRRQRRAERGLLLGTSAVALGALFAISAVSHAGAAPGSFWATAIDFAHLTLAAAWSGGLIATTIVVLRLRRLRGDSPATGDALALRLTARFSIAAAAGLYIVVATGILRSIGELPSLDALWDTSYGQWLIIKLALLTPLLAIALANRQLVAKWQSGEWAAPAAAARLRRTLAGEAALSIAVLFAVGVLGQEATPRGFDSGRPSAAPNPYSAIATSGDIALHLQITPNAVGENQFRLHVYGSESQNIGEIGRVQLTFVAPAQNVGGGESATLVPQGDGVFSTEGTYFSLGGGWQAIASVQRPGHDDIAEQFDVTVGASAAASAERSRFGSIAPQFTPNFIGALVTLAFAIGLALLWPRIRRQTGRDGGDSRGREHLRAVSRGHDAADVRPHPQPPGQRPCRHESVPRRRGVDCARQDALRRELRRVSRRNRRRRWPRCCRPRPAPRALPRARAAPRRQQSVPVHQQRRGRHGDARLGQHPRHNGAVGSGQLPAGDVGQH